MWRILKHEIKRAGREDILKNPTVLDLGGGTGEFSKYLNADKTMCVSLDIKEIQASPGANQVKADAYRMPFADESFNIIYGRGSMDTTVYPHDFPQLLPEIARALKKDGIFFTWDNQELNKEEVEKYFKGILQGINIDILGVWVMK